MPIEFACHCGRRLKVADDHAGKQAKCPACAMTLVIPTLEPDVVEFAKGEDKAYVQNDPPAPASPAPAVARPSDRGDATNKGRRKKKRRSRRSYAVEEDQEWGGRGEGGGWTMFGVHITYGVVTGAGMLILGLALLAIFVSLRVLSFRLVALALVCAGIGATTLIRSLFYGEED